MESYSKKVAPEKKKKKKRTRDGELEFALLEPRRSARRRLMIELENSGQSTAVEKQEPTSSSQASVQLIADPTRQTESPQPETLTFSGGRYNRREEEEENPSGDMDSSNSRIKPAATEVPSKVEIDEFLSAAESDLQKCFTEKYNFDAVNGVPLKGRYEWVRIKP